MAKTRRRGWQDRKPRGHGPRLLDGEVPETPLPARSFAQAFSWRLAVAILALGVVVALVSQVAC